MIRKIIEKLRNNKKVDIKDKKIKNRQDNDSIDIIDNNLRNSYNINTTNNVTINCSIE